MIQIIVPGDPVPQPRHRAGVNKSTGRPVMYGAKNDHPIWLWRGKIQSALQEAVHKQNGGPAPKSEGYGFQPFDRPVVAARFVFARAGKPLKKKANPTRAGGGRGDMDNLLKPLLDVGNDVGIWLDDGRVWLVAGLIKREASGDDLGDRPRAEFSVWDASEFTLETWVQWSIDTWPVTWSGASPIVKE